MASIEKGIKKNKEPKREIGDFSKKSQAIYYSI